MNHSRILEIIIATAIGAVVTLLSKVVEAYMLNHITSVGNVLGGIAASVTYAVERFKQV